MPRYHFKAIDAKGKVTTGDSSAQTPAALAGILEEQGLFLMESKALESQDARAPAPGTPASGGRLPDAPGVASPRASVGLKEVTVFTAQLAVMIRTALPLLESLEMLALQTPNPVFRSLLLEAGRSVREGQPLSRAFARYPKVFDEVYISLLASGEASGQIDTMLERLAGHLEFQTQLKEKVRSALVYPTIVVLTAVAVVAFLVVFVLPTFMEVFSQFNIELPLPTQLLIFLSDQVRRWWYVLFLGVAGTWWFFGKWLLDPAHTRTAHDLQLRIPILGELTRNIVMTRILRTLGSLTESGVPILHSLELAKAAAANLVFGDLLDKIIESVREGRGLSPVMAQSPFIPATVAGMIATGEKTGTLPEVVNKVARFYESETDAAIKNLFSALEPLFIVGLGLMIGGIAVSVLLPMFNLANGIQ